MRLVFAVFGTLFFGSAQAQQPASFVPITLDVAKLTQLVDEVPMTTATRSAIVKLIQQWEVEARHVDLAPVPADKATNGRK